MYFPNLHRLIKNSRYFLLSISIASILVLSNSLLLRSQVSPLPESVSLSLEEPLKPDDLTHFSDAIARIENKWQNDYERYFQRNFTNRNRSAVQIAKELTEIQQQTGIKSAVIWAIPQDDFLQLMLITPEQQFVVKKVWAANKKQLSQKIQELKVGLEDPNSLKYLPPARLIYRWLFLPLESYLEAEKIDTLLLCTGATLRSLPFAALHDGTKFAIEKYSIARIPAFNLTDTNYEYKPEKRVLATGASEFETLPPLPGITAELNTIVPKIWSGNKLIDEAFTVANLRKAHKTENFDIVHIASHSQFNPGVPEKSFIQFSDGKLNLASIAELELNSPQIDLLVLSSCETALGNEDAEFGFAGLAMQAGVKSALASLWGVDDLGTLVLMSEFYQKLRSTPIKSLALRQAQLSMLKQKVFVEETKFKGSPLLLNVPIANSQETSRNFQHPYYWAGFTVIGNPW